MKKLMVLAAVAAMALGAKAEYTVPVDSTWITLEAYPGEKGGEVIPNYMDYNHYYVLLVSDFNNWQKNSGRPGDLAAASWVTSVAEDCDDGSWATWERGDDSFGKITKMPIQGDNILVPWDPSIDGKLMFVAASDKAYYAEEVWAETGASWHRDGEFFVWLTLETDDGPKAFNIPEPTSGLLLLFGLAGLALKRKLNG